MTVDGNVTNIENCIYTLMSNCQGRFKSDFNSNDMTHSVSESSTLTVQDPTDVGMSGSVTGRGPVTGYDPPVQSYNGDYIPSLSSQAGYPY